MFIPDSFTFLIPRIAQGNPASSSPKPGDQGVAMSFLLEISAHPPRDPAASQISGGNSGLFAKLGDPLGT